MADSTPQSGTPGPGDPVEKLLEHAFEPPDQPPSVLEQLCAAAGIRARVELRTPDADSKCDEQLPGGKTELGTPRYQVFGEIAAGGMGRILHGRDVDLGREVALKVLHESRATTPPNPAFSIRASGAAASSSPR